MTPGDKILAALPILCQDMAPNRGSPIKGKLKALVLNTKLGDGWQAIAQFWFVEKWNVACNADPLQAVADVLTKAPDMTPYGKSTPDFVAAVDPEPAGVMLAEPLVLPVEDDGLLV